MTDAEIKKDLLFVAHYCHDEYNEIRVDVLLLNALDLINRQQADAEKQSQNFKVLVSDHRTLQQSFDNLKGLYEDEKSKVEKAKEKCIHFAKELKTAKAEIERLSKAVDNYESCLKKIEEIKSEAIKEFAERLKATANDRMYRKDVVYTVEIDNLVKEMVGDSE